MKYNVKYYMRNNNYKFCTSHSESYYCINEEEAIRLAKSNIKKSLLSAGITPDYIVDIHTNSQTYGEITCLGTEWINFTAYPDVEYQILALSYINGEKDDVMYTVKADSYDNAVKKILDKEESDYEGINRKTLTDYENMKITFLDNEYDIFMIYCVKEI